MFRKTLSLVLIVLLVNLVSVASVGAHSKEEARTRFVKKVKASILKLGTGTQARVEIKLLDKTKLKGYISEVGDEHFVVVDAGTGIPTTVPYPQVAQVKGNNLSTGAKVAITVGLFAFLLIMLARNKT